MPPYNKKKKQAQQTKAPGTSGRHEKKSDDSVLSVMLKLLFEKQELNIYDPATGMLNLDNFAECPDLVPIKNSIDFNTSAFCEALATVIAKTVGGLKFISVAQNRIISPHHLLKALIASEIHFYLQGLSFAQNEIKHLDFAQQLGKFQDLREVVFEGNEVVDLPEYRQTMRKRLPSLIGLDHEGLVRPPLGLPWPEPTQYNDSQRSVLEWIEQNVFHGVGGGRGANGLARVYHIDAHFSLGVESKAQIEPPKPNGEVKREIVRDYVLLRTKQQDRNRNALMRTSSSKVATGLTDVLAALDHCVYPKCMNVDHELDTNASVEFVDGPVPLILASVHGKMAWFHRDAPDEPPLVRRFHRTFSIVEDGPQYAITNDMLNIDMDADDVIFYGGSDSRLDSLAKKWHMEPVRDIFTLVRDSGATNSDLTLRTAADEVFTAGSDAYEFALQARNGNAQEAVKVVQAQVRLGVPISDAVAALESVGFDVAALNSQ